MTPTLDQIRARIDDIHARNVAAGWWNDPKTGEDLHGKRPALELLALVHSELSEGLEGVRKGLMDDKLPHRPMIEVELADAEIRACDLMGGFGLEPTDDGLPIGFFLGELAKVDRVSEAIGLLHVVVGRASIAFTEDTDQRAWTMTFVILAIHAVADKFGYDLDGAREEKLAFNAVRADHKPENRVLAGGKAF